MQGVPEKLELGKEAVKQVIRPFSDFQLFLPIFFFFISVHKVFNCLRSSSHFADVIQIKLSSPFSLNDMTSIDSTPSLGY